MRGGLDELLVFCEFWVLGRLLGVCASERAADRFLGCLLVSGVGGNCAELDLLADSLAEKTGVEIARSAVWVFCKLSETWIIALGDFLWFINWMEAEALVAESGNILET